MPAWPCRYHEVWRLVGCVLRRRGPQFLPNVLKPGAVAWTSPVRPRSATVATLLAMCSSFHTIRHNRVYLIHQSDKVYLIGERSRAIFTSGYAAAHRTIFSRSLQAMLDTLRRDIYELGRPGFAIDQVITPNPDPLATVRYACVYWVDHLTDSTLLDQYDQKQIDDFLRQKYLNWLEALSLLRSISEGIPSMAKLDRLLQVGLVHLPV